MKSTLTLLPTATAKPTSLPTVVPTYPHFYTETAGNVGHRTLWVVFVLMGLTSLWFYWQAARTPVQKRLLHILTALITTFAFLSYFAMATGSGITLHAWKRTETKQHIITEIYLREVYWARYIDWFLTTPLLLVDLCLLGGLNGASILVAVVADLIMVATGLFAALARHEGQKWGWYTIAIVAFLIIVWQVGYNGRYAVLNKDKKTQRFFTSLGLFTLLLWTVYPIIWGVAEGARLVSIDTEIVAFAILDILAKPVFGVWLLYTHDKILRSSLSIDGFWAHGFASEGALLVGNDEA